MITSLRLYRIKALVIKECRQIVRDPSSVLIAFILPLILLFLFGYGVSLDIVNIRIGLVCEDNSSLASSLADSFRGSPYFAVTEAHDRREFTDQLARGHLRGIIVIPATFTSDYLQRHAPAIQVLTDGVDPNTAKFVQNYSKGAVAAWTALNQAEQNGKVMSLITVEPRFWYNPELSSSYFLVPGSIAIVMTIVGTLLTSLVIAREWERGTMEALLATPMTKHEFLLGKLIPYFLLGIIAMTVCLIVAVFLFGTPFRGSLLALYSLSTAFLIPALGLGLLISTVTKNQFLASQVSLIVGFLPSFLLSGFLFEIDSMPVVIRNLTLIIPARHLVPSLQSVFLAGDIWPMFLKSILILLLMGAGLMFIIAGLTRKRID